MKLFYVAFVPSEAIELIFDNKNLFMLSIYEIYNLLEKHDENIVKEDYLSFASMKLGIEISSPTYTEFKNVQCDGIGVAIKGYFDCIYDDGSELKINELQDNLS